MTTLPIISTPCRGRCCRDFSLPDGPEVLREDYERWLRREPTRFAEINVLWPMLIYLGARRRHANGDRAPRGSAPIHHYTCAHHDPVSGLCMIYSLRPEMCSAYPYGVGCQYHECSTHPWPRRLWLTRPLWRTWQRAKRRWVRWRDRDLREIEAVAKVAAATIAEGECEGGPTCRTTRATRW